jgi:hypothetical protein
MIARRVRSPLVVRLVPGEAPDGESGDRSVRTAADADVDLSGRSDVGTSGASRLGVIGGRMLAKGHKSGRLPVDLACHHC